MHRWSLLMWMTLAAVPTAAWAQFGPGGQRPPGQPTQPSGEKEEGPAEAAPEKEVENPALQPLPAYPNQREKALQFLQLNGYIRFRTYLFHNFNLGFLPTTISQPPFPIPFSEIGTTGRANPTGTVNPPQTCAAREHSDCITNNLTSADMRLRLEPTINVSEQVRVKAQLDVFDNLVLGSTPEGYYLNQYPTTTDVPTSFFARSQASPQSGVNSLYSSIRAKRAWAEVRTPFGELRFGRMPNHWGMGLFFNNGDCLDCDYGQNVDRIMFATKLYGHFIIAMWDWAATGPTTQIVGPQQGQGVFYNADTLDDVAQYALAVGRMDKPDELKDKLDRGQVVFNYGGYFVYRSQDWSSKNPPAAVPGATDNNSYASTHDPATFQANLVPRHGRLFIPDLWLKLDWRKLHLEFEGALQVGSIGNLGDVYPNTPAANNSTSILAGGFVLRGQYRFLRESLKVGLEIGYASGDDSEDPNSIVNFRYAKLVPVNNAIHRFNFDPDYHVDLILFRRILGTVNNATYLKPSISYDIVDSFTARLDMLYSLANRFVAYPGNSVNIGLEFDISLLYKNEEEGFYAGVSYGVLFPFGALNHQPADIFGTTAKDAEAAQTLQARLVVKF